MAEHDLADFIAFNLRAGQRFLDDDGAQIDRGNVFQAAAIGSDGGAHSADDDDFTGHFAISSLGWVKVKIQRNQYAPTRPGGAWDQPPM